MAIIKRHARRFLPSSMTYSGLNDDSTFIPVPAISVHAETFSRAEHISGAAISRQREVTRHYYFFAILKRRRAKSILYRPSRPFPRHSRPPRNASRTSNLSTLILRLNRHYIMPRHDCRHFTPLLARRPPRAHLLHGLISII